MTIGTIQQSDINLRKHILIKLNSQLTNMI